jgi:lipoprotein-releasing system permease protein
LRYSFSRRRNRFASVIATVSMLGMVLGVASLITVLSIMNGFAGELRERILALVPHGFVVAQEGRVDGWTELAGQLAAQPDVLAVAPYLADKVILASRGTARGANLTAIDVERQAGVSGVGDAMVAGTLAELEQLPFSIVLGAALARGLGVAPGDSLEVTLPSLTVTPLGTFPRSKRLHVVGLFAVNAQPDSYQAYVSLATGQRLFGAGDTVDGLQLRTGDLMTAPHQLAALAAGLPPGVQVRDWTQTQGSLFRAVKMEKIMVGLLLLSVVAVAAFNIVSTLVMAVAEKRGDIAVLRTMGARSGEIMAIFLAHGLGLACTGIGVGAVLGVALASHIARLTATLEQWFGVKLFDPSVYFISELPARLQGQDVAAVIVASLLLSLLASVYPAWRASRIAPAEVLRYE